MRRRVFHGEISKTPGDIEGALQRYGDYIIPVARKAEGIPTAAPRILNPQSWWGVSIVRNAQWIVWRTGALKAVTKLLGVTALSGKKEQLPEYTWDGEV